MSKATGCKNKSRSAGPRVSDRAIRAQKLGGPADTQLGVLSAYQQRDRRIKKILSVSRVLPAHLHKPLQIRFQRAAAFGQGYTGKARVLVSVNGGQADVSKFFPKKKHLLLEIRLLHAR